MIQQIQCQKQAKIDSFILAVPKKEIDSSKDKEEIRKPKKKKEIVQDEDPVAKAAKEAEEATRKEKAKEIQTMVDNIKVTSFNFIYYEGRREKVVNFAL